MLISRRTALLGTAAAASFGAPVAMAESLNRAAEHEPLKNLWREYGRRLEVEAEIRKRASAADKAGDREACSRLEDEASQYDTDFLFGGVEHAICMSHARTIEGAVIQARLLLSSVEFTYIEDGQDVTLARNLLAGLERLAGGAS